MRKIIFMALAILTVNLFIGCKPSSQKSNDDDNDSTMLQNGDSSSQVVDTTVYGECVDGGHGAFILKLDNDSTREFLIDLDNDSAVVFGGVGNQGDQMAVTYFTNEFKENVATKVINLTTLQAEWSSLDRDFEIEKDGDVKSHLQGETRPWTSWRILNGHLLLNTDTFNIDLLDGDSLVLEDHKGVYGYHRVVKK